MKIDLVIVCLGNPGDSYEKTKHNIGFIIGDHVIQTSSLEKSGKKFKSILYQGKINSKKVILVKPQTYMNLSGEAIQLLTSFYQIPPEKILVIYDDIDLTFGHLRLREKGSAGTHNGMRSIISLLNTQDFPRLRVGIGPIPENWKLHDFVLSNFSNEQLTEIKSLSEASQKCIESILENGIKKTMSQFNGPVKQP